MCHFKSLKLTQSTSFVHIQYIGLEICLKLKMYRITVKLSRQTPKAAFFFLPTFYDAPLSASFKTYFLKKESFFVFKNIFFKFYKNIISFQINLKKDLK